MTAVHDPLGDFVLVQTSPYVTSFTLTRADQLAVTRLAVMRLVVIHFVVIRLGGTRLVAGNRAACHV